MHFIIRHPASTIGSILILVSTLACGSNDGATGEAQGSLGSATGSTCPSTSSLSYANFGQALIADNCLSCHSGRESPTLTTQAAVQQWADAIDRVAAAGPEATNTAMPQTGTLLLAQRTNLGEWLACGAP